MKTTTTDKCGHMRGYQDHLDRGELPCIPCVDAHLVYLADPNVTRLDESEEDE